MGNSASPKSSARQVGVPYNTPTTRQIGVPYGFHPTPVDFGQCGESPDFDCLEVLVLMSGRHLFSRSFLLWGISALLFPGCGMEKTPPYSPREALKTFRLPEGFRIELVAAEPEVVDPVAMAFDAQGRLFVVEMRDYPMEAEPRGKIRLLEDPNGDGRYEKSTVFAEGLHLPSSVMPWERGYSGYGRATYLLSCRHRWGQSRRRKTYCSDGF